LSGLHGAQPTANGRLPSLPPRGWSHPDPVLTEVQGQHEKQQKRNERYLPGAVTHGNNLPNDDLTVLSGKPLGSALRRQARSSPCRKDWKRIAPFLRKPTSARS